MLPAELHGARKRDGTLPASARQIPYARDLARRHGVDDTFDGRWTRKEINAFLDAMRSAGDEAPDAPPGSGSPSVSGA